MKRCFDVGFVIGATLLLSCCAVPTGVNFNRKAIYQFKIGLTSKNEILETLGKPKIDEMQTIKKDGDDKPISIPVIVEFIAFYYHHDSSQGVVSDINPTRTACFWFSDDKLIALNSWSNFISDSTDFDHNKIKRIEKDKSTKDDVMMLFGAPSGYGVYPFAKEPGGSTLFYNISYLNNKSHKFTEKRMVVFLNKDNVVKDVTLDLKFPQ